MSTFLELCQDVSRESGIVSGTLPAAVTSQTGIFLKIVNWVIQSWKDIQNERTDWKWRRSEFTGSITANTARYTNSSFSLSSFSHWILDRNNPPYIYLTSDGVSTERELSVIDWEEFRSLYVRGTHDANYPAHVAESPSGELCFGPTPDATYTVRGEHYLGIQTLAANDDTPLLPAAHHSLIWKKACMYVAAHEEASLLTVADAKAKYIDGLRDLERLQLPKVRVGGGPLA